MRYNLVRIGLGIVLVLAAFVENTRITYETNILIRSILISVGVLLVGLGFETKQPK